MNPEHLPLQMFLSFQEPRLSQGPRETTRGVPKEQPGNRGRALHSLPVPILKRVASLGNPGLCSYGHGLTGRGPL